MSKTITVDIWTLDPRSATPAQHAACLESLDRTERERHAKFRFDHLRRDYAVAHHLVRWCLSDRVRPADWRFRIGKHGRPSVAHPLSDKGVHFSLSHTDGCVAVATSREANLGVDVERAEPRPGLLESAHEYFAEPELAALRALPDDEQMPRFFDLWTLKESYIKARGLGLAIPLHGFWFHLDRPHIGIDFDVAKVVDDRSRWSFSRLRVHPRLPLALAVESRGVPVEVRWREVDVSDILSVRRTSPAAQ